MRLSVARCSHGNGVPLRKWTAAATSGSKPATYRTLSIKDIIVKLAHTRIIRVTRREADGGRDKRDENKFSI